MNSGVFIVSETQKNLAIVHDEIQVFRRHGNERIFRPAVGGDLSGRETVQEHQALVIANGNLAE